MRRIRPRLRLRTLMGAVAAVAVLLWFSVWIGGSREAAAQAQCLNNLKQIGLALHNYATANDGALPCGTWVNEGLPAERRLSWFVAVWSDLEQLFWVFDTAEPWDAEVNRVTRTRDSETGTVTVVDRVAPLNCPAAPDDGREHRPGLTAYVGIAGVGADAARLPKEDPRAGVFGYRRQVRLADVTDGTSMTMVVVETADANGPWTAGGRATVRGVDPARRPYLGRGRPFGGMHRGGTSVLFADGSVRCIRAAVRPRIFEALATIAGREPFSDTPYP